MLQVLLFDYNIGKSSGSERQILGASSGRGCEDPSPTAFPRVGWVGDKSGTGRAAGVRKGSRAHGRCRGWLPASPFVCDLKTQVTQRRLPGRWSQLRLWPLRSCVWLARGGESGRRAVPMAGHRVQRGRPRGLVPPTTTGFVGAACPHALLSLEPAVRWLPLLFLEVVCHSKWRGRERTGPHTHMVPPCCLTWTQILWALVTGKQQSQ